MIVLENLQKIWQPAPALEITILAVGIYYALMFVRGTRGWPVVIGFVVVLLALTAHCIVHRLKCAPVWLAGYAAVGVALVVNGSRAGVLLYLLGSVGWIFWTTWRTRSLRLFGWSMSGVLIFLTLFFAFGGKTLERFMRADEPLPSPAEQLRQRFDPGAFSLLIWM